MENEEWRMKNAELRKPGSKRVSAFHILHSTFYIPHSAFLILHSTFYIPHSAFLILHSTFYIPHSAFLILHSSFYIPHSAFLILHSAFLLHSTFLSACATMSLNPHALSRLGRRRTAHRQWAASKRAVVHGRIHRASTLRARPAR